MRMREKNEGGEKKMRMRENNEGGEKRVKEERKE